MSTVAPALANSTHHPEHLADRAAMLAMRAMIALEPAADFGPASRSAFDDLMAKTPTAEGVTYEAATVGGLPGWWRRPASAIAGGVILYLHGGAYRVLRPNFTSGRDDARLPRQPRPPAGRARGARYRR